MDKLDTQSEQPVVERWRSRGCRLLCTLMLPLGLQACDNHRQVATSLDFNWDIRPILSENCFLCHGPDPEGQKAGLRLDLREFAVAELPEKPGRYAVIPGDPDASELIRRISAADPDERMPPPSSHKTLTDEDIDTLRQWIAEGAEYKPHWAFIAPTTTEIPSSPFNAEASPIDSFIHQGLAQANLEPAAQADKAALINRASLTLTGLPPTLAQVDAFIADDNPDAYEQLLERLLASPAYAEHMAGYWLDLARWADSDGFLDDHHDRFLWPWRDWVIQAFADNMPFDQFGTWQLAGDLLPNPSREQILATTYLRLGKRTTENGAIEAEYRAETLVERTDNALGTAFLGLTLGCARCHDHRYDSISHQAYYQLGAFFNSHNEPAVYAPGFSGIQGGPTLPWMDADSEVRVAAAEATVDEALNSHRQAVDASRQAALATVQGRLDDEDFSTWALAQVTQALTRNLDAHYPLDQETPASLHDLPTPRERRIPPATINSIGDGPYAPAPPAADETPAAREQRELLARVPRNYNAEQLQLSPATNPAVPPAVLQAPIFTAGIQGQALVFDDNNKGFLGKDVGWFNRTQPFSLDFWFLPARHYQDVTLLNHRAEQNSGLTGYQLTVEDGRPRVSLAHAPPANMISLLSETSLPVGEWSQITLTYDGSSQAAGVKLYLNGSTLPLRVEQDNLSRAILPWTTGDIFDPFVGLAFGTRFRARSPVGGALDEIRVYSRQLHPLEVKRLHDEDSLLAQDREELISGLADIIAAADSAVVEAANSLISAREAHDVLVTAVPQVLVMAEAPQAPPTHILERGVYNALGEQVHPRGLDSVFAWDESLPANRLGLTQWLFDPRHPLTARVFVNRIWQMHFGRGLVETAEDFGSQGAIPSHPELLDWLALRFMESGWDVKALHKEILMSASYRQDSTITPPLAQLDPANTLLARGPRWRMPAEMLRDHALAVSGLLLPAVGGPSTYPYQPEGIWNPLNSFYPYPEADRVGADQHHRRSLYTFVKRNAVHPAMQVFDFHGRGESRARRTRANTPLQALNLFNDPQFVEAYRLLATRVLRESNEGDSAIAHLYRIATRDHASENQLQALHKLFHDQWVQFSEDPDKAMALLSTGITVVADDLDQATLAAMTQVAAVVLNSPDAYSVR